ncbi:MAG: SusC/RagA family TonB-linked outer membrane protein [Bacteroidota bacterium]
MKLLYLPHLGKLVEPNMRQAPLLFSVVILSVLIGFTTPAYTQQLAYHVNSVSSQDQKMLLRDALISLEKQYKISINYASKTIQDRETRVLIRKADQPEQALQRILEPLDLQYKKINESTYVVQPKKPVLKPVIRPLPRQNPRNFRSNAVVPSVNTRPIARQVKQALEQTISGQVLDLSTDEALPGVNILAKGTTTGTVTDVDGNYRLTVGDEVTTLVFSSIGYETTEEPINERSTINISLSPDIQSLSEVVVIGYGTQEKRDLTGSLSSIKQEKIKDMPITTIDQGLQGLAAGVSVQQQTGQPGGATSIRIRGGNSINAGNEPLYVIDGFPIYNENTTSTTGTLNGVPPENALATINPNDIVSIEILKDASATAIYGARAANGVVLITTKRGKAGQSNVDFDMYYGIQEPARRYDLMNAYEYAQFRNERWIAAGEAPTYTEEQLEEFRRTGGTDWQDELLRSAPIQNYQLGVSGGKENVQYAFSGNYFNQQGTMINSFLKRISTRANVDIQANDRLHFGLNFTAAHTWSNQLPTGGGRNGRTGVQTPTSGNIYQGALFYNPAIPVFDENGEYTLNNSQTNGEVEGAIQSNVPYGNPIAYANLAENRHFSTRILNNLFGEWEIIEGLKLRVTGGANLLFTKQNRYEPSTIWVGQRAPNGRAQVGTVQNIDWLNENILSYERSFGGNHQINLTGGFTVQAFQSESLNGSNVDFTNDVLGYDNLQGGNAGGEFPPSLNSGADEWQLMSGLFRAFYSLKDRYLFTVTGRYDGSSRFGENNKWAFFPSAAVGWRISDEAFMADQDLISNMKLRVSWGRSGNQNIPTYRSLSSMGTVQYTVGDALQTGFFPNRIGNPDLKWETTTQTDIGLDVGLFQGRLELTADYYYKKTTDLLFDVPVPFESGFRSAFKNIGSLENQGVELALNATPLTGNFTWNIGINWALNRNQVLELQGEEEIQIDPGLNLLKAQNALLLKVGEPVGNFYGYVNDGIWQNAEEIAASGIQQNRFPGQYRFIDQNSDGIINNDDRTIIGNALPDWTGGITNTLRYKNIELNFLIDFSYGNDVANLTKIEHLFLNGRQNGSKLVLDRWRPDDPSLPRNEWTNSTNPETEIPSVLGTGAGGRQLSSFIVEDGSFARLRNLTLAYNVPVQQLGISALRRLRLYFSGQNLLLFTNYSGLDPEANVFVNDNTRLGLDYAVYPPSRTYTFGVNIGL